MCFEHCSIRDHGQFHLRNWRTFQLSTCLRVFSPAIPGNIGPIQFEGHKAIMFFHFWKLPAPLSSLSRFEVKLRFLLDFPKYPFILGHLEGPKPSWASRFPRSSFFVQVFFALLLLLASHYTLAIAFHVRQGGRIWTGSSPRCT